MTPPHQPLPGPSISVVVCTHNRSEYLTRALRSLVDQRFARDAFEVLVVDNRSTDDTRAVAERYANSLPLRYLFEPELGLCQARNAGWKSARGAYVAYLDDDAVAEPEWLGALHEAFEREPRAGVVGGRVLPIWEAARPDWLSDNVALSLTVVDWPGGRRALPDLGAEWLVGANMAAPRAVLEEIGGFHPWLDRAGTHMLSSGDVFLEREVVRHGYLCVYEPAAVVHHLVPAGRLTKPWFRRRYLWQGVSDAVMQIIEQRPSRARRLELAAHRAGQLARSPRQLAALALPARDAAAFDRQCWTLIAVGQVAGLLGAAKR